MEVITPRPGLMIINLSIPALLLVLAGIMVTTSPLLTLLMIGVAALMAMVTTDNLVLVLARANSGLLIQDTHYMWAQGVQHPGEVNRTHSQGPVTGASMSSEAMMREASMSPEASRRQEDTNAPDLTALEDQIKRDLFRTVTP